MYILQIIVHILYDNNEENSLKNQPFNLLITSFFSQPICLTEQCYSREKLMVTLRD